MRKIVLKLIKAGTGLGSVAAPSGSVLWGKPRRFVHSVVRSRRVRESIASRRGACQRCGACCKLGVTCKFYTEENGLPACTVHGKVRPPNCTNFPITPADIRDRDRVMPQRRCGYSWPNP